LLTFRSASILNIITKNSSNLITVQAVIFKINNFESSKAVRSINFRNCLDEVELDVDMCDSFSLESIRKRIQKVMRNIKNLNICKI